MKRILAIILILALSFSITACGGKETEDVTGAKTEADKPLEVAVVVKGTDSEFWQTVISGAEKAGEDLGSMNVTSYGPPTEGDLDEQTTILENVVNKKPDIIVLASTSPLSTVPIVEKAYDEGIKIVLIDGMIDTDKYHTFLATDNKAAGALAADRLVEVLTKQNKELKGDIGIISAMAGVSSLTARNDGFVNRLKEIAPEIRIADVKYSNGDILKAVSAVEDMITTHSNLIGIFADNNQCGAAAAQIITERGLEDEIVAIAFDADPVEIEALKAGALDGIVLQDPYGMGYKAVENGLKLIKGESIEQMIDTGVSIATQDNLQDPKIDKLLYPSKR